MVPLERVPFRLVDPREPDRIVRGVVDAPRSRTGALPHVVVLHGFKGFMDWGFFPEIARRVAAAGFVVVRYNASGSGVGEDGETFDRLDAFERNTLSREIEDLERVRAWIRAGGAAGADPERGSLLGHSRGGGIALVHAAERGDCRCVVAWAPVATFDRFDDAAKEAWRADGFLRVVNARTGQELRLGIGALEDLEAHAERFDVPRACRRISTPTTLVHGEDDESVPAEESRRIAAAIDPRWGRLVVIPGAGHTFGIRHPMTGGTESFEKAAETTLETLLRHG